MTMSDRQRLYVVGEEAIERGQIGEVETTALRGHRIDKGQEGKTRRQGRLAVHRDRPDRLAHVACPRKGARGGDDKRGAKGKANRRTNHLLTLTLGIADSRSFGSFLSIRLPPRKRDSGARAVSPNADGRRREFKWPSHRRRPAGTLPAMRSSGAEASVPEPRRRNCCWIVASNVERGRTTEHRRRRTAPRLAQAPSAPARNRGHLLTV